MVTVQTVNNDSIPHVEIVRGGSVLFSTLTDNVSRVQASIARAKEVAAHVTGLVEKGVSNLSENEVELLDQLRQQAANLPDPNIEVSGTKAIYLADLDYDETSSRNVKRQCSFELRNAKAVVDLGLNDTSTPLTDTDVVVFWDVDDVTTIFSAAKLPASVLSSGRIDIGTYRIDQTSMSVEPDGSVTLSVVARDAMQQFVDIALAENLSIPAGSNPVTEIIRIIRLFDPGAEIRSSPSDETVGPLSWEQGTSYMEVIQDIAQAGDLVVYVDRNGVYHVDPRSTEAPDDILDDDGFLGFSTSTVVAATRDVRRNGVINGVIVRGENITSGGAPVESAAWITTGPYAYNATGDGGIGPMPLVVVDRAITTEEQARQLAESKLKEEGGVPETVTIQILQDPSVSAGDIVTLNIPEIGAQGAYTVASVSSSNVDGKQATTLTMTERRGF